MSNKPNCFKCKHRGEVPGSAHSKCHHPSTDKARDPMIELVSMLGANISADVGLNVKGDEYGISQGWFNWPYNFDPVWLKSCDGFEEKENGK